VDAMKNSNMGVICAALQFGVPCTTQKDNCM